MLLAASGDMESSESSAADQTAAAKKLAWCQNEYVSAKDCDSWVADQMARKAARKADEEARKAARKADEQKRREERREDEEAQTSKASDTNVNDAEPLMLLAA